MNKEFILRGLDKYKQLLETQALSGFEVKSIPINENFLFNIDKKGKEECQSQTEKNKLEYSKNLPVLYWFSFAEDFKDQEKLRNTFINFSRENNGKRYPEKNEINEDNQLNFRRAISAIRAKSLDVNTRTLYVGKVKKGFWGRLATHSGWATSPKTAGLQLKFWYDFNEFPSLQLNYITFEKEMDDFVSILEIELTKELKPLIGKK